MVVLSPRIISQSNYVKLCIELIILVNTDILPCIKKCFTQGSDYTNKNTIKWHSDKCFVSIKSSILSQKKLIKPGTAT